MRNFLFFSHLFATSQVSSRHRIFRRVSGVDKGVVNARANIIFYSKSLQPLHIAVAESQKAKLSGWIPCLVRYVFIVCVGLCLNDLMTRHQLPDSTEHACLRNLNEVQFQRLVVDFSNSFGRQVSNVLTLFCVNP